MENTSHLYDFAQKTALVTGAAQGIGLGIARALEAAGARVFYLDHDAEALAAACPPEQRLLADVGDRAAMTAAFARLPALDLLVCSAGTSSMAPAAQISDADWHAAIDTNLRGTFLANQLALARLEPQGSGVILNISAMAGKIGPPLFGAYAASKAGVIGWTQSLAREVAPMGIRANVICPGFTQTGMQAREIGWDVARLGKSYAEIEADYIAMTPMGRLETVEDVARVALFLLSDQAGFVTGQAINITGGLCLV